MISELMPYISGTLCFLGSLILGILSFKIYKPQFESNEQKEKYNEWLKKFSSSGRIFSIALMFFGVYFFFIEVFDSDINQNSKNWSVEHEKSVISTCMKTAKAIDINTAKKYCECAFNKVQDSLSFEEYSKNLNKSKEQQYLVIKPIIKDCIIQLKIDLDSLNAIKN